MIHLAIKTDIGELADNMADAEVSWIPEAHETTRDAIISKTDAGYNADGNPMSPYKEGRHKQKRIEAGLQVGFKDLKFTGDLKASIISDGDNLTVEERVMPRAAGNDEREDFFAVGEDTLEQIESDATDRFSESLGL